MDIGNYGVYGSDGGRYYSLSLMKTTDMHRALNLRLTGTTKKPRLQTIPIITVPVLATL